MSQELLDTKINTALATFGRQLHELTSDIIQDGTDEHKRMLIDFLKKELGRLEGKAGAK